MAEWAASDGGASFQRNALNPFFWAKLTDYDGSRFFEWTEYTPTNVPSSGSMVVPDNAKFGTFASMPAFDPNNALGASGVGKYALLRRSYYDAALDWVFAIVATSSGSGKVLVQITSRTYPGGGTPFALYSCNVVTDDTTPSALTYTATVAGPDFYNLNDVDLPVGLACWIFKSDNGSWYLNDNDTRVDVIAVTGTTPDANGLLDGVLRRYNDGTHVMEDRGAIKVLDISGP